MNPPKVWRTVFMLAVIRLVWRLKNPAPPLPAALMHHFWNQDDVLVRMLPNFRSENKSS